MARYKAPVLVLHALGWKCVGVWSITMVATHLPPKACDAHVINFTRPSSRLTNFFSCLQNCYCRRKRERRPGNEATSYLVVPTFDILTCDDVLLPRAGSTGLLSSNFAGIFVYNFALYICSLG